MNKTQKSVMCLSILSSYAFIALIVMCIIFVSSKAYGGETKKITPEIRKLLHAICMVESSNVKSPKDGDGGRAIGNYQIWRVYWKDATDFDKSIGGTYETCRTDKAYSERIVMAYWSRYCSKALANNDFETLARCHNGGWNGPKKKTTNKYWEKVKKYL